MRLLPQLALVLVPSQAGEAPVLDQVAVRVRTPAEAAALFAIASDVDTHLRTRDGTVVIYADDAEQARLRRSGLELVVLQEDLAGFYAARAAEELARSGPGGAPGVGSMGGFRTLSEVVAKLDALTAAHPSIVSPKFSIGTSVEGRPIWAVRISDHPAVDEPDEPVAWFDALHHAREPMSGETLLQFADWLVARYPADPVVRRVVDSRNVVLVPVVNPDGYLYNEQIQPGGGGLWRKNRRDNGNGTRGVDLNRNYDWEWGPQWPGGSSSSTSNDTYRGPSPFSEPEARAVRDALLAHPPGMVVSAHSASNLWLFPWSYADGFLSPQDDLLRHYAAGFASQSDWPIGTAWQILSNANGTTMDWSHGVLGCPAYTPEIGSTVIDGFWPAPSRIPVLFEAVRPGYLQAAQYAGGWADELEFELVEVDGDGDESLEAGEAWELVTSFVNRGVGPVRATVTLSSRSADVIPVVASTTEFAPPFTPLAGRALLAATYVGGAYQELDDKRLLRPRVRLAPGIAPGVVELDVAFAYDTAVDATTLAVLVGPRRELIRDDMEQPVPGWTVTGDAAPWAFERAEPQETASVGQVVQPGEDNPAGQGTRCWVTGAAAGSFASQRDVDGLTVLTSPRFDASGFGVVELSYARWFANLPSSGSSPLDDELVVEVSNDDGASWTELERVAHDNAWRTVMHRLEAALPLTDAMRLRFTAADVPENDLTEACVDDVVLRTASALPTLGLWGAAAPGATVRLCVDGVPGAGYAVRSSTAAGPGTPDPGAAGLVFLAGTPAPVASGTAGADGRATVAWTVPARTPPGTTLYLQVLADEGGPGAAWSNLVTVAVP